MKHVVHILAHVRNPKLLDAALFVFRTLRVGFPTANAMVWGNAMSGDSMRAVADEAKRAGCGFNNLKEYTPHDVWIEQLIEQSFCPFWVCDTDIAFWKSVEDWTFVPNTAYAGRYEPPFWEEWTGTTHVGRLHPCLMWFDAVATRNKMREWMCKIPAPWRNHAIFPFIRQMFIPFRGRIEFWDTCAGLYASIGGTAFTEEQNQAFDHLCCATYADLISPKLTDCNLTEAHKAIYANTELARGIRKLQDEYYARQSIGDKANG